jgi:hypothetical protein
MLHLGRKLSGRRAVMHFLERTNQVIPADDPEHVEPAQGVNRHEATGSLQWEWPGQAIIGQMRLIRVQRRNTTRSRKV